MNNTIKTYFLLIFLPSILHAAEVTIQNDSLGNLSNGAIQSGFVAGEKAASWLDIPCDGDIVAVQVFWRSLTGGAPISIEERIEISAAGTFPVPGALLESIVGPVLTDGVINEFRFLDENNVIPLNVPVLNGETIVLSFTFGNSPSPTGPSLVTDVDGCLADRNGLYAIPPGAWFSSCLLGVSGDFVMRAVVDCSVDPSLVDLSVVKDSSQNVYAPGEDLSYVITVSNSGPNTANAATVIDFFPAEINSVQWMCVAQGGASCTNVSGNGNIAESVNIPTNGSLVYTAVGTVAANANGIISNTAQVITPAGLNDTDPNNNSSTKQIPQDNDLIFASDFEAA